MTDKIPEPKSLSPADMPWARAVTDFIRGQRRRNSTTEAALRAANSATAGLFTALEVQAQELEQTKAAAAVTQPAIGVPTEPILSSSVGSITADWDGEYADNAWGGKSEADPTQIGYMVAEASTTLDVGDPEAPIDPFVQVGTPFRKGGTTFLAADCGATTGDLVYVRFRAFTADGRQEMVGEVAEVTVVGVHRTDLDAAMDSFLDELESIAIEAQESADGKNTIHYGPAQPPLTGNKVGDTWFDSANGNRINEWDGTTWVPLQFDEEALDSAIMDAIDTAVQDSEAAIIAANGKNKIVFSPNPASGTTGYVAGDVWFQRASGNIIAQWEFTTSWQSRELSHEVIASIDAGKITVGTLDVENRIAANAITGNKIAANAITAGSAIIEDGAITNAKIGNIDAGKITSGEIDANRIGARSITTNKMLVGNFTNLVPDPTFQFVAKDSWRSVTGDYEISDWTVTTSGNIHARTMQLLFSTLSSDVRITPLGTNYVTPGEAYAFGAMLYKTGTVDVSVGVMFRDIDGSPVGNPSSVRVNHPTSSGWQEVSGIATIPDSAVRVEYEIRIASGSSGQVNFAKPYLRQATSGQLIVDGAIDGKTITGATVRTASSGQRMQLDSVGLRSYNSAGSVTGQLTASSGGLTLSGTLRSGSSNQRAELKQSGLEFYSSSNELNASLIPWRDTASLRGLNLSLTNGNVTFGPQNMAYGGTSIMRVTAPVELNEIYTSGIYYDGRLQANTVNLGTINASANPNSFPVGVSFGEAGSGFPASIGTIENIRHSDYRHVQYFHDRTGPGRSWVRTSNGGTAWQAWREIHTSATPGVAYATAAGHTQSSVTVNNNSGRTITVTLPSGLFSHAPIPTVTNGGSARLTIAVISRSTTQFQVRQDNWSGANASGETGFFWQAMQMYSSGSAS